MKENFNFKIDSANYSVSIEVSSAIFPIPVIILATYHFIENRRIIVEKGNDDKISVTFIPNQKVNGSDLEELAHKFNVQLISSFVKDREGERHAGIRNSMFKAALLQKDAQPKKRPEQQ